MAASLTAAETIALLHKKSQEEGDEFWVKVYRRRVQGALPDAVATFSGANVHHFMHPEMWIPRILGGGPQFLLAAYHVKDTTLAVGDQIVVNVPIDGNPPKHTSEIDFSILKSPTWQGPRQLEWPTAEDRKQAQQQAAYSVPSLAAPPSGNSAANNVPGGGPPSGFSQAQWQMQQQMLRMEQQTLQLQTALEAERERSAQFQRDAEETRRKQELDSVRREAADRAREQDAKMEKLLAKLDAPREPVKAAPTLMEQVPTLAAAFTPLFQMWQKSADELRLQMSQQQSQQQAQTQAMITALMGRPSVDPAVEKSMDRMMQMFEKNKTEATPPHEMLHNMAEAMQTMTAMTLDLAEAAANVGGGGQRGESPALSAIKQGVKAVTSLMEGYQQSVAQKMGVPPQQYQQPVQQFAAPPQYQPQPQPQQHQMQPQTQQAQVVQFPPRQPQPAAPPQAAQPGLQVVESQPASQVPSGVDSVTHLENMIKAFAPPPDVAKQFITSIDDKAMQDALTEAGDDPNELVAQRLGGWVLATPGASQYLGLVLKELEKQGVAAGIFEADGDGDDDDGDDDGDAADAS